ncbi:exodeoxyribonuclease V subunit alpha [Janthinobacterium psychrotolerans]|uniref:RecBCD enzyme subunit RecD n=1 Tax=Janthinobacterium psychrotolerans TaxID=1747903 RepID=A0A1A7C596_9BURK|nr:exodeoxyribonuclease V subunit alpha [Janthinobacterium psychrotolerans]OBV40882.1 exodeoxyribonuclease V alpha subunit [Janthinobacterium psychrotolerans]
MHSTTMVSLLAYFDGVADAGQVRRLGAAFARFVATLAHDRAQAADGPALAVACVVLSELEGRGHSCVMLAELAHAPSQLMGWSDEQWQALLAVSGPLPATLEHWCTLLARAPQVWSAGVDNANQPLVLDGERLYLRRYWRDETAVGMAIATRATDTVAPPLPQVRQWLDVLFDRPPEGDGPDWQKVACAIALRARVAIITGGPGTGKTYTVASLLTLLFAVSPQPQQLRIALAAPTGKAAARLKQSIDKELTGLAKKVGATVGNALDLMTLAQRMGPARTLHSLLGARPGTRAFAHHAGKPLDVDVLIVDEASMVHLEMMASVLDALPPTAILILLGDKDQLASVEAGAVLGDLCHDAQAGGYDAATIAYAQAASGVAIPASFAGTAGPLAQQTVMLRHSHRFGGPIGALALAVNEGRPDLAKACFASDAGHKVAWKVAAQPDEVLRLALAGRTGAPGGYRPYLELVNAGSAAYDSHDDWVRAVLRSFEAFRILCAVREGEWGVAGLNTAIELRLEREGLLRRAEWYVGRPVMVTRNDYGTGVFNGDIGLSLPDPARPGSLRVYFLEGDKVRSVLATRLRQVETAFAMTVHKSQGSEFKHTVLVLPQEGGAMLARELVYTGITRARDFFTLVSPTQAVLFDAILRRTQRASGLRGLVG